MAARYFFISAMNVADHRRGGANICALAYLQAVAAHAPGRVTLISPLARDQMPELPDGVDEVIAIPARSSLWKLWHLASGRSVDRMSPFVDRLLRRTELHEAVVFLNASKGGRFARWLGERGVPSVTLFHNVEADFHAASEPGAIRRRLIVRAAAWNDRQAFEHSHASIFLTAADAEVMRQRAQQRIPGATVVECGFFSPIPVVADHSGLPPSDRRDVLLNCSLGLSQNVPGILSFLECWSRSAGRGGLVDATLVLAGSNPSQQLREQALRTTGVRLVADPSDQEMEQLFASCRVCVSTIDAGSGIKVRVSEALRRGRPVVATPHSCVGYEGIDSRVVRRVEIAGMIAEVEAVLATSDRGVLERLARHEFDEKLSFSAGSRMVGRLLDDVERRAR
jgi:glycosyltransferase involved in cell wall biosynthesis